ncbi:MAG: TGS domain-containing protein [Actinobacteria bacterium]|nr:MAG: TGS domain-containing protein [Actinomycetota bacterium]
MPMPHRTFAQVARRRLVGKEGSERVRTIRALMDELPDYRNGPYADLRKWLQEELDRTRMRAKVVYRDSISVRREGAAQVALVGAPNAGKSSLLQALSNIQIRTGDYAFTTLRPVPALTSICGVPVQLVEIPGLIEGATEDRGGGRALLGVLRGADAIVLCQPVTSPVSELETVRAEIAAAGIEKPTIVAATKVDDAPAGALAAITAAFPELDVMGVSVLDDALLDEFRGAVFRLTGLIRVHLRKSGEIDGEPLALHAGATVADVADAIHHELGEACIGALLWGPSGRFPGQRVGREHVVVDGDAVEILT